MRWQSDRTLLISVLLCPAISINDGTQKNKVTSAQTNKQQPMALKSATRFCLMVTFNFFLMKESTFKTLSGRMKDCTVRYRWPQQRAKDLAHQSCLEAIKHPSVLCPLQTSRAATL